jgi:hypothetical protein
MRTLLAVALVAAAASTASAGTYLGLGIGTAASPSGDLPMAVGDGGRTGHLLAGWKFGNGFSIEGQGIRYGLARGHADYDGTALAVAAKYSLPLGNDFEAFGRLGVARTWLSSDVASVPDYQGNGLLLGAGFEYQLKLGATAASLFVDYQRIQSSMVNQNNMSDYGAGIGIWTLGATVSL